MANTFNLGSKLVLENGLPMTLAVAASDPGSAVAGDMYFNTTSHSVRYYDGSAWQSAASAAAAVTAVSVVSANGLAGSSSGGTTPALTLSTTITGILQGNGTAISAASTTGSGAVVLANSPSLVTPDLGTPSALVLTHATGLPLTSGVSGILPIANGGTNASSAAAAFINLSPLTTAGDLIYENASPAPARLGIGSSGQVLTVSGGLPSWQTPSSSSITFTDASTVPIYAVSGSPGNNISITLETEAANSVFAGPASGADAQPEFRALVANDIPDLSALYESVNNFAVRSYQNSMALAANTSSPATISALTFAFASYGSMEMKYVIIEASTGSRRQGSMFVATDGSAVGYSDQYAESAQIGNGIVLSAAVSGSNIVIQFTGTNTNACTMRAEITKFVA